MAGSAYAQSQKPAGVSFELGTQMLSANDARFDGGSNLFRLQFRGEGDLLMFYSRQTLTFGFKNGGAVAAVPGQSNIEGVGLGMLFSAMRLEFMTGRAWTTAQGAVALSSSDPVTDIGFYYTYKPGAAFLDLGLIYRSHKLSVSAPGNVLGGGTQTKTVDDLGGTLLNLGIGYGF
jgi:hypothetical protein